MFEALPEQSVNRVLQGSRYDDQIAIFGQELQDKFAKQNIFLVGAGALGCEYLKMFSLMGVSLDQKGGVLRCTDDDNIEMSNLNRQFLFRKENVGHSKAECACKAVQKMNSDVKYQSVKLRVCQDNDDYFNDEFWEGLDCVVNAVDNVNARLYVDSRCVFYQKPLMESGTLGTKCNSQVIKPFKTQSYGDSQDPPEESIPLCTLKNFPYQIEHTIQWARDYFEGIFVEGPNQTAKYLQNPQQFVTNSINELRQQTSALRARFDSVERLSGMYIDSSYEKCVQNAREMFEDVLNNQIQQLLYSFPLDHRTSEGQLFWSGPKRPPTPISFNPEDEIQLKFIQSAANIFAYTCGLPEEQDLSVVAKMASNAQIKPFKPKNAVIKTNDKDTIVEKTEDDDEIINNLGKILLEKQFTFQQKLNPVEFEKDDDTNYHIEFISATANLRARNYKIPEVDKFKVKMIAGKIIPAIATTTAMVVGAVGIEVIKLVLNKQVSKMKNSFMNLAVPLWLFSEPSPPIENKDKEYDPIMMSASFAIPKNFTNWDKINVSGPLTLQEVIDHLQKQFNVTITTVVCGKTLMYNPYLNKATFQQVKDKEVTEAVEFVSKAQFNKQKKYVELEVSAENENGDYVMMPMVKYTRKL